MIAIILYLMAFCGAVILITGTAGLVFGWKADLFPLTPVSNPDTHVAGDTDGH